MDKTEREYILLNELSKQSRSLGQAHYLLQLLIEEESIGEKNKERVQNFLLDIVKTRKLNNTPARELAEELLTIVFHYYGLPRVSRYMKSRKREFVKARQVCMYFLESHFRKKLTLAEIGHMFHKDHATVIHSVKTIQDGIDIKEPMITKDVKKLKLLITKIYE